MSRKSRLPAPILMLKFLSTLGRKISFLATGAGAHALLLLAFLLTSSQMSFAATSACQQPAWIDASVARIAMMKDSKEKLEYANLFRDKVTLLTEQELDAVPGESIDLIAMLLEDDNDLIKAIAADALGRFGYRAVRAVPALVRASEVPDKPNPPGVIVTGTPLSSVMLQTAEFIRSDVQERGRK